MIRCYFGLPGCGKSTLLAKVAVNAQRRIDRGLSPYKYVYSNVFVEYPGIRSIRWEDVGVMDYCDCLILIDEATLFADNRSYKTFPKEKIDWLMTHRHDGCDMYYFAQFFNAVDKKIRDVTAQVYYVKRFGPLTQTLRIPKGIVIPEQTGEIVEGYRQPKLLEKIFTCRFFYRRPWYKYFNSWVRYTDRKPVKCDIVPGSPKQIDLIINEVVSFTKGLFCAIFK